MSTLCCFACLTAGSRDAQMRRFGANLPPIIQAVPAKEALASPGVRICYSGNGQGFVIRECARQSSVDSRRSSMPPVVVMATETRITLATPVVHKPPSEYQSGEVPVDSACSEEAVGSFSSKAPSLQAFGCSKASVPQEAAHSFCSVVTSPGGPTYSFVSETQPSQVPAHSFCAEAQSAHESTVSNPESPVSLPADSPAVGRSLPQDQRTRAAELEAPEPSVSVALDSQTPSCTLAPQSKSPAVTSDSAEEAVLSPEVVCSESRETTSEACGKINETFQVQVNGTTDKIITARMVGRIQKRFGAAIYYEIMVETGNVASSTIQKRYRDFRKLDSKLRPAFPNLPSLPPKSIFRKSEMRIEGLRRYVQAISETEAAHSHHPWIQFIGEDVSSRNTSYGTSQNSAGARP
eukprot:TRINITY_DN9670_c0_g1_i1.p1 TRINITY_DN9670_c0_g1~~TRINITY_DN9670_c0_g1_i1.p1  ORF type:complete len:407 (+),score=50.81 TRINITY_DN9670_c0_g1_i1:50-1270(+)